MIHREDRDTVAVLRMEHGKANAVDTDLFADIDRELDARTRSHRSIFSSRLQHLHHLGHGLPHRHRHLLPRIPAQRHFDLALGQAALADHHA